PLCTWTHPSKEGHRLNIFFPQGQDLVWQLHIAQAEHSEAKAEVGRKKSIIAPRLYTGVEECNLHGALLWALGAEKMRDIKGAGLRPYWQVSLCG
ncbi:hypothetical protein PGIGA_G00093860, partial [Pangasianodon gigas]|nr:hypothetical protein [Pangasianodon gigas]